MRFASFRSLGILRKLRMVSRYAVAIRVGLVILGFCAFGLLLVESANSGNPDQWLDPRPLPSGMDAHASAATMRIVEGLIDRDDPDYRKLVTSSGSISFNSIATTWDIERQLGSIYPFKSVATISGFQGLYVLVNEKRATCRESGCDLVLAVISMTSSRMEGPIRIDGRSTIGFRFYPETTTRQFDPASVFPDSGILVCGVDGMFGAYSSQSYVLKDDLASNPHFNLSFWHKNNLVVTKPILGDRYPGFERCSKMTQDNINPRK